MLRLGYIGTVYLGQTIHIVVALALKAEVLCKVDNLDVIRNLMLLQESLALAMSKAEEHNIHIIERHIRSEAQVGLAIKTLVHIGNKVAGITLTIDKRNLGFRVIEKYADKFASCVTGSAKYTYFHIIRKKSHS